MGPSALPRGLGRLRAGSAWRSAAAFAAAGDAWWSGWSRGDHPAVRCRIESEYPRPCARARRRVQPGGGWDAVVRRGDVADRRRDGPAAPDDRPPPPSSAGPARRAGRSRRGERRGSMAGRGRAGRDRRRLRAGTAGARGAGRCGGAPLWRLGEPAGAGAVRARPLSRAGQRLRSPCRRRRAAAGPGAAGAVVSLCATPADRGRAAASDHGRAGAARSAAPVGGWDHTAALRAGGAARTACGAHAAPADQSRAVLRCARRTVGRGGRGCGRARATPRSPTTMRAEQGSRPRTGRRPARRARTGCGRS